MVHTEIQELGFQLRGAYDDELVYEKVFTEVEVTLHIMTDYDTFYLSYDNGFINCTTSREHELSQTRITDVLNPFLYNITRLLGVESKND